MTIPLAACVLLAIALAAPPVIAQDFEKNSEMTHGNVQMNLQVGQTTQLEVLEIFGAPNITTIDGDGQETWIYRKHATVAASKSQSGGFIIGLLGVGGNVGAGAGGGYNKSKTGFEQSSRTMTLIIKFSQNKVVIDFRSRSSSF